MIGILNKTLALLLIFPMTVVGQEFDIKEIDLDFNDIKSISTEKSFKKELLEAYFVKTDYFGVGITYDIIEDTIIVKSVVAKGPSEKAGVFPGDKIVVIGSKTSVGVKTYEEVRQRLMGIKESEVRLGVKRNKQPEILYFTIIRKKLNLNKLSYGINIKDKDTPNPKSTIWANWWKNQQEFSFKLNLKNEKANQLFQKITNQIKSECNYYTVEGEEVYYSCPKSQYKGKIGFYIYENSGYIRTRTDL